MKDEVDDDEFAEVVGKTTEDILDEIDNLMADNEEEDNEEPDPGLLVTTAISLCLLFYGKRSSQLSNLLMNAKLKSVKVLVLSYLHRLVETMPATTMSFKSGLQAIQSPNLCPP